MSSSPEFYLWNKRLRYDLVHKWRMLRMMIDGVIVLYFIVPALIAGSVLYFQGLQSPPIWWNTDVAMRIISLLLLVPMLFNVRPLFSLADEGLLIASPLSPRKFILFEFIKDGVIKLVATSFVGALFTPYLLLLEITYVHIGLLLFLGFVMSILVVQNEWMWLGKTRLYQRLGQFLHMLFLLLVWVAIVHAIFLSKFVLVLLITVLLISLTIALIRRHVYKQWSWDIIIREAVAKRMSILHIVLGDEASKKEITRERRRPATLLKGGLGLAFRPENALFLLYAKGFLRMRNRYFTYVQALVYIELAVLFVPIWWMAALVLGVGLFMLANVLIALGSSESHAWTTIYPFTHTEYSKGMAKGAYVLNSIVAVIGAVLITVHVGSWLYVLPIGIVALFVAYGSVELAKLHVR